MNELNQKITSTIANPVRCRLLIEIMKSQKATAKSLAAQCPDIPQTTMYRSLKRMTEDGILKITSQTPIRGTVEKTYALAFNPSDLQTMAGETEGTLYMQMFFQYFLTFAELFQSACDQPEFTLTKKQSDLSLFQAYLTDKELKRTAKAIAKILKPLQENKPARGRKLRTLGLIVAPEHMDGESANQGK